MHHVKLSSPFRVVKYHNPPSSSHHIVPGTATAVHMQWQISRAVLITPGHAPLYAVHTGVSCLVL